MTLQTKKAIYLILLLLSTAANSLSSSQIWESSNSTNYDKEPEFDSEMSNATVAVGREVVLACSVTDLGNYKIGWMRVEDQTILSLHDRVVTQNGRISVTHDNFRTWHLRIRQVKESDKGCYMCQINTNMMKKQLGCIDVHIPPDIDDQLSTSDLTRDEGENATLICHAVGHPKPRITWKREDGGFIKLQNSKMFIKRGVESTVVVETFSGEKLELVKLDRHQMGSYLCIASNDVPPAVSKRVSLNINFAPIINVEKEHIGGELGSNVSLLCYIEAFPYTTNYWIKRNENQILHKSHRDIDEVRKNYVVEFRLTISILTSDDFGTYSCIADNSFGRSEQTIYLHQIIPLTTLSTATTLPSLNFTTSFSKSTMSTSTLETISMTLPKTKDKVINETKIATTKIKQKQKLTEQNSKKSVWYQNSISTRSEAPFLKFMSNHGCGSVKFVNNFNYIILMMNVLSLINIS